MGTPFPDAQDLLRSLPEAILVLRGREVACANRAMATLLGVEPSELHESRVDRWFAFGDADRLVERIQLLRLGRGSERPLMMRLSAAGGRVVPAEARVSQTGDYAVAVFRERTAAARIGGLIARLAEATDAPVVAGDPERLLTSVEPILVELGWRGVLWRVEGNRATPVRLLAPGPQGDPAWAYAWRILGTSFPLGDMPRIAEAVRTGEVQTVDDVPEVTSAFHARRGGQLEDVEDHRASLVEQALLRGLWVPFERGGAVDEVLILSGADAGDIELGAMRVFARAYGAARRLQDSRRHERHHRRATSAGEVAEGLAEEIRAPLVRGAARIQRIEQHIASGRDARVDLDYLRVELDRLLHVTEDFLAFVRPRSPQLESVDLSQVVHRALRALRRHPSLGGHAPALSTRLAAVPPVRSDPELLGRALENLLLDAWQRGLPVRLETGVQGDEVWVRVTEEGRRAESGGRLFAPFRHKDGGAALGLAVVREAIESVGGRVEVSPDGTGLDFTLWLPRGVEHRLAP